MNLFKFARFKVCLHIFLGLILGSCIALVYLSTTDHFRMYVQARVEEQFLQDFNMKLRCKIDAIDWFACRIELSGIHITQDTIQGSSSVVEPEWSVVAEKLVIQGSWLSLLLHRALKV